MDQSRVVDQGQTSIMTGANGETVFCVGDGYDNAWYVVKGGSIVNLTPDLITDGMDIELLFDMDCFSWPDPINTIEELVKAVEA